MRKLFRKRKPKSKGAIVAGSVYSRDPSNSRGFSAAMQKSVHELMSRKKNE